MKATTAALVFGLALAPSLPTQAAEHNHDGHAMASGQSMENMEMAWADGTVKKINPDAGKVTITHGPLSSLDMPAMTMVFRVKDPAWLAQMKPGDRIRFVAERLNGALTVTDIQASR